MVAAEVVVDITMVNNVGGGGKQGSHAKGGVGPC